MGAGGSGNAIAVAASQAIAATQQLTGRRTSRYLMKRRYINTRSSIIQSVSRIAKFAYGPWWFNLWFEPIKATAPAA